MARALVGKYALDRYREKPEREDDDPERLLALETLTLSARAGVAAAAAALGQLHYYDALDAQEAFDVLCKASGNDSGVAPRIPDHLNLARGWYKEALEMYMQGCVGFELYQATNAQDQKLLDEAPAPELWQGSSEMY